MSGRTWAYTGAILGGSVSIAANIAHSFIPPKEAITADWSPETGAVVGAVVWPVFLFVAVEILARVAWPDGRIWHLLRWGGLLPVAAVAALVSYRHGSGLLAFYGEEPIVCVLGPLAVDGLMVMATGALLATGTNQHTEPTSTPATPDSTTVPAPTLPPLPVRPDVALPAVEPQPASPAPASPGTDESARSPEPAHSTVPTPDVVASRVTKPTATSPARPDTTSRATALSNRPRPSTAAPTAGKLARPATDTPVTGPDAAQLKLPLVSQQLLARADQLARQYRTENGEPITAGQLAARLRVNSEKAAEALALLALAPDSPTTPIRTVNGNRPSTTRR
ncbi:hypothetical protein [Actinoplanes awajinensis]|uniref:DUF2637 domain-containing protein n=1 Tax=Actinoplanes awajinensis subsp. mycoplanecinus TaxID=135947 RepID=A0A0X3UYM9_9ACTN|nr:hypothetical protein [Actinoplanes awajinensis]KUL37012.1 hypothetical protein ADL15_11860 [Actinoplanes awajinensis subsp. mycoplanecinus]